MRNIEHDNLGVTGVDFNPFLNLLEREEFDKFCSSVLKPDCIAVEIGTREGYSASVIAKNIKKVGGFLYCVDPWGKDLPYFNVFRTNMELLKLNDIVFPLAMKSENAARIFKDGIVDFVFIDGDHSYEGVNLDIKSWLPKLKPDGVMSGHDFIERKLGVYNAVTMTFGNKFTNIKDTWLWYIKMGDYYGNKNM